MAVGNGVEGTGIERDTGHKTVYPARGGPAFAFSLVGKTIAAYFEKLNADGGIDGRKIRFISYDDEYSPCKTVEQARRLVEDDGVLLILSSPGTAPNNAIRKYMNANKVPQLFVFTGASEFGDPKHFPCTMGWTPTYQNEGRAFASGCARDTGRARS